MSSSEKSPNKLKTFFSNVLKEYDRDSVRKLVTSQKKEKKRRKTNDQSIVKKKKPNISIDPEFSNPIEDFSQQKTPERLADKAQKLKMISSNNVNQKRKEDKVEERQPLPVEFSFKDRKNNQSDSENIESLKATKGNKIILGKEDGKLKRYINT